MARLKPLLRAVRNFVYRIAYRGTKRVCPVCGTAARRFRPFGIDVRREQAMCVYCGALERHRLVWLFLERKTDVFSTRGKRFLHIAPEPTEIRIKQRVGGGYVSADLSDPTVDVHMDVTRIPYPAEAFDVVYCSHVLEHVADDRLAMREMHRVLAKDGLALFLVPITASATVEDPSETDPKERLRRFGQDDHVRRYGPDFVDRLREAGFRVQRVRDSDVASAEEISRMGLAGSGEIFLGTRIS